MGSYQAGTLTHSLCKAYMGTLALYGPCKAYMAETIHLKLPKS